MERLLKILAWTISVIFHPIGMTFIGCLLIYLNYYQFVFIDIVQSNRILFIRNTSVLQPIFFLFYVLPIVVCGFYCFFFMRPRESKTETINDRLITLSLVVLIYSICFFNTTILPIYSTFILSCIIVIMLTCIITLFWKISMHCVGIGGLLGLQVYMLYLWHPYAGIVMNILPFFVISAGLVGTARLYLQAHSQKQIYVGYLVGFIGIFTCLLLFKA